MIVCLCNAISDRQIRVAAESGCATVGQLYRCLGCRPQCGKCLPEVRRLFHECCGLAHAARHRHAHTTIAAALELAPA